MEITNVFLAVAAVSLSILIGHVILNNWRLVKAHGWQIYAPRHAAILRANEIEHKDLEMAALLALSLHPDQRHQHCRPVVRTTDFGFELSFSWAWRYKIDIEPYNGGIKCSIKVVPELLDQVFGAEHVSWGFVWSVPFLTIGGVCLLLMTKLLDPTGMAWLIAKSLRSSKE